MGAVRLMMTLGALGVAAGAGFAALALPSMTPWRSDDSPRIEAYGRPADALADEQADGFAPHESDHLSARLDGRQLVIELPQWADDAQWMMGEGRRVLDGWEADDGYAYADRIGEIIADERGAGIQEDDAGSDRHQPRERPADFREQDDAAAHAADRAANVAADVQAAEQGSDG